MKKVAENRSRLQELRFKLTANQVKNVREIRTLRKEVAKMFTELASRSKEKKTS